MANPSQARGRIIGNKIIKKIAALRVLLFFISKEVPIALPDAPGCPYSGFYALSVKVSASESEMAGKGSYWRRKEPRLIPQFRLPFGEAFHANDICIF